MDPRPHPAATPTTTGRTAPRLLFLGGANPISTSRDIAAQLLTQARARGIRTHVATNSDALRRTAEVVSLADEVSVLDPEIPGECQRWARDRLAAGDRFDLVLGLRDGVLPAVAEVAALFGVPGNSPAAVRRTRNKDSCREALASAGFRQPDVRLCNGVGQAAAFLRESTGPWVVKPRDGMGSIGVRKVTRVEELPEAVEELPDPDLFLVEEFVEGPEFSVEGVFLGGRPHVLAVTAKEKLPPPHFVEVGHVLPADVPEEVREEAGREVAAALTALGLRFGPFHVELWHTAAGVVLGEVHARPGGDWLHRLLSHSSPGLELFGLIFDDALGRAGTPEPVAARAAAAWFLAPPPGRLVEVRGWERLSAHPAVLHAELDVRSGASLPPVRQSGDRAGVVVVGAATPVEARRLARELAASVEFVVE